MSADWKPGDYLYDRIRGSVSCRRRMVEIIDDDVDPIWFVRGIVMEWSAEPGKNEDGTPFQPGPWPWLSSPSLVGAAA